MLFSKAHFIDLAGFLVVDTLSIGQNPCLLVWFGLGCFLPAPLLIKSCLSTRREK
jgi:hypothetical protein